MRFQKGFGYEYFLRPNYEMLAFFIWVCGGLFAWWMKGYAAYPLPWAFRIWLGLCLVMAVWRVIQGLLLHLRQSRMERTPIEKIGWERLRRQSNGESVWLGQAFAWTPAAMQQAWDILKSADTKLLQLSRGHWIHGLGDKDRDLHIPLDLLKGHTLIVGSTGTGKTRLFDLMIAQAIARGEAVIIIDPKGDHDLRENARLACERLGRMDRFVYFHPAFPKESVRLDPLRNFNRATELATRVAALIPSETKTDPFQAFGWLALNTVVQGLVFIDKKPNLLKLRRYVEGGVNELLKKTLLYYYETYWQEHVGRSKLKELIERYQTKDALVKMEPALDGLITMHQHNRDHFQKMVASLIPLLSMLTSGSLQTLLSPKSDDSDIGELADLASIIEEKKVLYIGLDSLSDATVGGAIGSIMLADLTAVASDRYNFCGDDLPPVNVFIDEAAEVVNEPAVQLLNKSRGAGFRVVIATQTLADLEVRTGTKSGARQVIGNTNNWIFLRIIDAETQKYIAEALPKTSVKTMDLAYRSTAGSEDPLDFKGTYQESLKEKDMELFPPALLGIIPDLHYFGRFADGTTWKGKLPILVHKKDKARGTEKAAPVKREAEPQAAVALER